MIPCLVWWCTVNSLQLATLVGHIRHLYLWVSVFFSSTCLVVLNTPRVLRFSSARGTSSSGVSFDSSSSSTINVASLSSASRGSAFTPGSLTSGARLFLFREAILSGVGPVLLGLGCGRTGLDFGEIGFSS